MLGGCVEIELLCLVLLLCWLLLVFVVVCDGMVCDECLVCVGEVLYWVLEWVLVLG